MAQEILVRITTDSSGAVKGLSDVKKNSDETKKSYEGLTAAQKAHVKAEENLKKAMDSTNVSTQKLKLETKEYNQAALERAKILRNEEQGIKEQASANEMLSKSFNDVTRAEKKLLIEEKKQELQLRINKKQIELYARAEMGDVVAKQALQRQTQKVTQAQMAQNQATQQGRAQSGLSNAILLETSRLASDASFGFTAIANNLSQVITLMASFARTEKGGFGAALSRLGKDLLGTGGLLVGVQLLISFGPKIVAFFTDGSEAARKFRKEMEKTRNELKGQRLELMGYIDVLRSSTASEEVRLNALKELETVVPGLTKNNKNQKISLEELTVEVEEYIKQQALRAELDALVSNNTEMFAERERVVAIQRQLEATEDQSEREAILLKNQGLLQRLGTFGSQVGNIISGALSGEGIKDIDLVQLFKDQNKGLLSEYETVTTRIAEIQRRLTGDPPDTTSGSGDERTKVFQERLLQLEKLEQKYREKSQKADLETDLEKLARIQQNEMAQLDIMEENFIRKEQLRLENYKKEINERDLTDKQKAKLISDAEATFANEVRRAGEDRIKVEKQIQATIRALRTLQIREQANIAERDFDKQQELLRKFVEDSADILKLGFGAEADYFAAREDALQSSIERQQDIVNRLPEGLEKTQAQIKLFDLEDELRQNDLKKEIAYINNKKRINTEYANFAQGIAGVLNKIAGENEALQKAALVIEKGAAIAKIVIDSTQSIARGRAEVGVANLAALKLPAPFSAIKIASNESLFAKETAMTKVGAAISIANILATTLTSFKKPTGGTSGGGSAPPVQVQAPDFNVVGASPVSQLAQVSAAAGEVPIKTYVTSKDIIDSIDEFNRNIDTAGLG